LFDADINGNGQTTFTAPAKPGSYPYHCEYHGSMHGTLIVQ
jgi:plastocyanin